MKLIKLMSDQDSMKIEYYQSVLEEYGIKSQSRNISISSLGGLLPPSEIWPELWVLEEDQEKAQKIIEETIIQQ